MRCYSGRPIAPTGLLIDEGVRRLKAAGSDVVLNHIRKTRPRSSPSTTNTMLV